LRVTGTSGLIQKADRATKRRTIEDHGGQLLFTSDFIIALAPFLAIAAKMALVLTMAFVLNRIQKKLIARAIQAGIPTVKDDHGDNSEVRSRMITAVIIKVITAVITIVAVVMLLGVLEVDTAPLLATLGVASLGMGFAAQDLIRDYLQGFFIFMEDWYRIGDWVVIAGKEGGVEEITPRRTVLREIDGTMHIIPHSQITQASNQTRDWARINLLVSVAYKENIAHVYQVIDELCQDLKDDPEFGVHLITTPAAMRVSNLGDHGVDICIRGDTAPGEQWGLTGELRKRIKNRFDQEGIEIPWPHTKVYFGEAQEG
jgi:small-conductance mechanosensitive channel